MLLPLWSLQGEMKGKGRALAFLQPASYVMAYEMYIMYIMKCNVHFRN